MATPLESEIMRELDFGHHPAYFNASSTAEWRRNAVPDKLSAAIQTRANEGVSIAPPDSRVIAALKLVAAHGDVGQTVANTWRAVSEAIAGHIEAGEKYPNESAKQWRYLGEVATDLKKYLPKDLPEVKYAGSAEASGPRI